MSIKYFTGLCNLLEVGDSEGSLTHRNRLTCSVLSKKRGAPKKKTERPMIAKKGLIRDRFCRTLVYTI